MPVTAVLEGLGLKPRMHDPDLAVARPCAVRPTLSVKVHLPEGRRAAGQVVKEVAEQLVIPGVQGSGTCRQTGVHRGPTRLRRQGRQPRGCGREHVSIEHVLAANTPLPARPEPQRFGTAYPCKGRGRDPRWRSGNSLVRSESAALDDNGHIAEGLISGLPPANLLIDIAFGMELRRPASARRRTQDRQGSVHRSADQGRPHRTSSHAAASAVALRMTLGIRLTGKVDVRSGAFTGGGLLIWPQRRQHPAGGSLPAVPGSIPAAHPGARPSHAHVTTVDKYCSSWAPSGSRTGRSSRCC